MASGMLLWQQLNEAMINHAFDEAIAADLG